MLERVQSAPRTTPPPSVLPPGSHLPSSPQTLIEELRLLRMGVAGGDANATARQYARGKLAVRDRLELLLDHDTFREIEPFRRHRSSAFGMDRARPHSDGVVTGWGDVFGRRVFVYAHDFRIYGGALGEAHAEKIHKLMDLAESAGCPLVSLNDGAGARIQEGVTALAGYGGIFARHVRLSGVIPQLSVMLGPCAGGASYSPALTDFVFMVDEISQMFLTGPDVVESVTGERVTLNELGGSQVHSNESGLAHFRFTSEEECLESVRYVLSYLPANNKEDPPTYDTDDPADRLTPELCTMLPERSNQVYDMRRVIGALVDDGEFIEVHEDWGSNLVCAFARIDGRTVGVVANQPMVLAGALDLTASQKGSRFVQFCDSFNIPLITLVDVPGFMPGVDQERSGAIRHGAKLLFAYCNATVPRVSLVLRKAFGGAYIVMDSRSIGADLAYAWPSNEIAVMGAEGAASIIFRREIATAGDPDQVRSARVTEYQRELMHSFYAAERGLVDDVIDPGDTRRVIADALSILRAKPAVIPTRKHANQPS